MDKKSKQPPPSAGNPASHNNSSNLDNDGGAQSTPPDASASNSSSKSEKAMREAGHKKVAGGEGRQGVLSSSSSTSKKNETKNQQGDKIQLAPGSANEDAVRLGENPPNLHHHRELAVQGQEEEENLEPQAIDAFVVQEDGALTEEARRQEALARVAQGAPLVEGVFPVTGDPPDKTPNHIRAESEQQQRRRNYCLFGSFLLILVLGAIIVPLAGLEKLPKDSSSAAEDNGGKENGGDRLDETTTPATAPPTTSEPSANPSRIPSYPPSFNPSGIPSMVPTTPAPTSKTFASIVSIIYGGNIPEDNLPRNPESPQWKALQWLAEDDPSNITLADPDRLAQRYALVTLYFATNGETWTNQFNFLSGIDECEWFGNTALEEGEIGGILCERGGGRANTTIPYSIQLDNNNLIGTLPDELSLLTGLTKLDVHLNPELTGTIPSSIAAMENLQILELQNCYFNGEIPWSEFTPNLYVRSNFFTGAIPTTLDNDLLVNLTQLRLYDNYLTGSIPSGLFSFKALAWLDVGYNIFDGTLPDISPGALGSLIYLNIAQNSLIGTIPESIGNMTSLFGLDVSINALTGSLPKSLTKMSSLILLRFGINHLTGSFPFLNGTNPNLETIFGPQNNISGTLDPLGYLPKLQAVLLEALDGSQTRGNRLTGSIPTGLCALTDLVVLGVSDNNLTGTIPECLGNLTNLYSFTLRSNNMMGTLPTTLQTMTKLETLGLSHNSFSGTFPGEDWIGNLSSLRSIILSSNQLNGTLPETALSSLLYLRSISIRNNHITGTLPEFGTNEMMNHLQLLEYIDFGRNQLTGTVPVSYQNLPVLERLFLDRNQITGDLTFLCNTPRPIQFVQLTADCYNHSDSFLSSSSGGGGGGGEGGIELLCPCCTQCCDESPEIGCDYNY